MAFKTFAPGVLTSSDVNTFLMRQSVIVATSSTRPASPNEGMTIYETDTNLYLGYDGANWKVIMYLGDWIAYTPTVTGTGFTLGNATVTGRYFRVGDVAHVRGQLVWGSTTTGPSADTIAFSTPSGLNASATDSATQGGLGSFLDTSLGGNWVATCFASGASIFWNHSRRSAGNDEIQWTRVQGATTPATGDVFRFNVIYEVA